MIKRFPASARPLHSQRYPHRHRKLRKAWAERIAQGFSVHCARCLQPITQGMDWDLDHTDDRTGYLGPSHSTCNRSAGATAV